MPTTIYFTYGGEWKIDDGNKYNWHPWSSPPSIKAAVVEENCCSLKYLYEEIYRSIEASCTSEIKLSYLSLTTHFHGFSPIYINTDSELKAYMYSGGAFDRPILHVFCDRETAIGRHTNDTDYVPPFVEDVDRETNVCNDAVPFDRDDIYFEGYHFYDEENDICNGEREMNSIGTGNDKANNVSEAPNLDINHVQNDAENVTGNIELPLTNNDVHLSFLSDRYSFTDGSNMQVGDEFASKEEVKKKIRHLAIQASFEIKNIKSTRSVYAVRCKKECCSWRIWTSQIKNSSIFSIRTYCNLHTCDLLGRVACHAQTSSSLVCDMLVEEYSGGQYLPQPKAIRTMMRNKGMSVSYYKAWKGKLLANDLLIGDPDKSYALLPRYLKMVEIKNPGSITLLEVDEHSRFKYAFMSIGTCIMGYRSMRKVVTIDGTWLKGKYQGTLLVASAEDGNGHQFPLAWGIVNV